MAIINNDEKVLECFYFFKEIRILINHHFNPLEIEIVDKKELEINNVKLQNNKLIEEYRKLILKLLKKYGYSMESKWKLKKTGC